MRRIFDPSILSGMGEGGGPEKIRDGGGGIEKVGEEGGVENKYREIGDAGGVGESLIGRGRSGEIRGGGKGDSGKGKGVGQTVMN